MKLFSDLNLKRKKLFFDSEGYVFCIDNSLSVKTLSYLLRIPATIIEENDKRNCLTIRNETKYNVIVKFGIDVTNENYDISIKSNTSYDMRNIYRGSITAMIYDDKSSR